MDAGSPKSLLARITQGQVPVALPAPGAMAITCLAGCLKDGKRGERKGQYDFWKPGLTGPRTDRLQHQLCWGACLFPVGQDWPWLELCAGPKRYTPGTAAQSWPRIS